MESINDTYNNKDEKTSIPDENNLNATDVEIKNNQDDQKRESTSTIVNFGEEINESGNLSGLKVESLSDVKSIDSVESVRSLESINTQSNTSGNVSITEKWYCIALQVAIPFLMAGGGTIVAGIILGKVEKYQVFKDIDSIFILVPAILGLKGNLDMCLASRLSTQANLGNMNRRREIIKMIIGNIGLVQVQAIVAAVAVSIYAVCASAVVTGQKVNFDHALLITCCSILTATLSCFALDFLLTGVIFTAHKCKVNPDNLATPLAACIGDAVSLIVLSIFAQCLYEINNTHYWAFYVIITIYICLVLPMWIVIVRKNKYTRDILTHGWIPVLSALLISGMSGLILEHAITEFNGFVVFQPIINGVGGNLVSVQSSRISTMLHKSSLPGLLPPHTKQWVWPWTALFSGVLPAKTARMLILMAIPGQILFVFVADLIYNEGKSTVTAVFVLSYLAVGIVQVMVLLYFAHLMIHFMWRRKIDPDNSAIPYLTSLGDFIGSGLLLLAFMFSKEIGCEYSPL